MAGPAEAHNTPVTDDLRPEDGLSAGDAAVERLAGVCRLWGVVEYFHPHLAYRDVDWDAALVETLPAVVAAESPEAYRAAIDRLLGHLGDPVTRTVPPEGGGARAGAGGAPEGGGTAAELAVHRAGGVAVVVATDYERVAAPARRGDPAPPAGGGGGRARRSSSICGACAGGRARPGGCSRRWPRCCPG